MTAFYMVYGLYWVLIQYFFLFYEICIFLTGYIDFIYNLLMIKPVLCDHLLEHWVSEWLLFNTNSAIFQLYHGENKLFLDEKMMMTPLY